MSQGTSLSGTSNKELMFKNTSAFSYIQSTESGTDPLKAKRNTFRATYIQAQRSSIEQQGFTSNKKAPASSHPGPKPPSIRPTREGLQSEDVPALALCRNTKCTAFLKTYNILQQILRFPVCQTGPPGRARSWTWTMNNMD